ncbi:ABC transporter ATP-binding protein [Paenibacillus pasadenensis]|uniref:ABC transporter ATP-binding protein n=1 Tax=Paenibacillus pasadenensis TaxID=217090 RepID=UPI00041AF55D|nr:ABC transporter ATP-binding protein [Paenibacillus pasadenensis]
MIWKKKKKDSPAQAPPDELSPEPTAEGELVEAVGLADPAGLQGGTHPADPAGLQGGTHSGAAAGRIEAAAAETDVLSGEPLLQVSGVQRSFPASGGPIHVLKGITMEVPHRRLVMLKGRSGSGKTTLLNLIGGLDTPSSGEIWFDGEPIHKLGDDKRTVIRRERMGFIFQAFALMPLLSAYENVELSLRMAGTPRSEWKGRVEHCLAMVGLERRMKHRPFEMSGGEQQRVAIAKAIAHRPRLLLADEPTAELDTQMSAQIMSVFRTMIQSEGVTICMTTHDPTILEVADHVYEMVDGTFI